MLAEKVSAATPFDWGMISHVVDDAAYDAELRAVVQTLAEGPAQCYPWMKRALSAAALTTLPAVQSIELEGQVAADPHRRVRPGGHEPFVIATDRPDDGRCRRSPDRCRGPAGRDAAAWWPTLR
jgi:enoyl-CoA hydratase/carnithine racemase